MFRYSILPTGIEYEWLDNRNSMSDPAAMTGSSGMSSRKYLSMGKAAGAA